MIFADLAPTDAIGAVLVHSVRLESRSFKKGRALSPEDCAALAAAGIATITTVRLEPNDIGEDAAARALAESAAGEGLRVSAPFTGRANLFASAAGVLVVDTDAVHRLNAVDETVTVATLPAYSKVDAGQMIATVKVIPYAVDRAVLNAGLAVLARPPLRVAPFRATRIGWAQTTLPGMKPSILDRTTEVTRARVEALGSQLVGEAGCDHTVDAVAAALGRMVADGVDILLIAGASAVADRRDVLPAGIVAAGGHVRRLGMPVDPGNLLVVGDLAGRPVIGLPGCARSPKFNGFDWVLERLVAGLDVDSADIARMGVGGLLKEIATRPQPRDGETVSPRAARVAAIVLAAGKSSRMGRNKLLVSVDGQPMVTRAVDALIASAVSDLIVVVGNQADEVRAALGTRPLRIVENPDFADGMSTSLKAGLAALPADADAFLVALGDMPRVTADDIDRLIAAYDPEEGRLICVPTHGGRVGNPILWDRRFMAAMAGLTGDTGARHLMRQHGEAVVEVAVTGDGVLLDVDTPAALAALDQR